MVFPFVTLSFYHCLPYFILTKILLSVFIFLLVNKDLLFTLQDSKPLPICCFCCNGNCSSVFLWRSISPCHSLLNLSYLLFLWSCFVELILPPLLSGIAVFPPLFFVAEVHAFLPRLSGSWRTKVHSIQLSFTDAELHSLHGHSSWQNMIFLLCEKCVCVQVFFAVYWASCVPVFQCFELDELQTLCPSVRCPTSVYTAVLCPVCALWQSLLRLA